ncbi:MAG: DNA polymerase III subunit gamma/tau [Ignavibacteriales bacterium]|nr:DNA polymerase III subunit gamma/tau [Ignavibacteriales bacterium]
MSFVVTARKYRPQRFDEVVGQEHITQTLKSAIHSGRVAHAYLLTGPRGVGKTTTARILAKSLNCLNPQDSSEPCNHCDMCLSITNSQLIDIIEIDAASNRGIDEIRTLRESVRYAPSKGKYKVYIIDEVHMLTKDSFNAFLKTLEEPPPHVVFIFATTDVHRVPLTILSRCQRYDFRRIQLDTIKELLSKIADTEGITIDDKTLTLIAKKADGGLRDAESFFDQVVAFCGKTVEYSTVIKLLNVIDDDMFFLISDSIANKSYKAAFEVSESLYQNGWNYTDFIDRLIEHFRNILVCIATGTTELIEVAQIYKDKYTGYQSVFSEADILRIVNYLGRVSQELKYSQNHKLRVELALAHVIGLERTQTISELLNSPAIAQAAQYSAKTAVPKKPVPAIPAVPPVPAASILTRSIEVTIPEKKIDIPTAKPVAPVPAKRQAAKNDTAPLTEAEADNIKERWNEFRTKLATEKQIQFGSFEQFFEFGSAHRNVITVECADHPALVAFEQLRKDFIEPKAMAFFGKKFTIKLVPKVVSEAQTETSTTPEAARTTAGNTTITDPYVKIIIEKLGGQKYR